MVLARKADFVEDILDFVIKKNSDNKCAPVIDRSQKVMMVIERKRDSHSEKVSLSHKQGREE